MKITNVTSSLTYFITTDTDEYRRGDGGNWERLWGCSWEDIHNDSEIDVLEAAFLKHFEFKAVNKLYES